MGRTDPDPRRKQILNLLEETGTLNVGELADRFGVSLVTIRKDLDELGAEGLLDRTFGGAVFSHRSRFNRSFLQRALEHGPEKRAIAAADPAQTAFDISALETRVNASLASRKLIVWLLTAFAGLALLLALIGIYGLISYVTVQRTGEIGIRMALGAQRSQVVGLVMKSALLWVVMGLVLGLGLAIGVRKLVAVFNV